MGGSRLQKLSMVCLISSTVPSATALTMAVTTARAVGLLERAAGSCPDSNFSRCDDAKLPSNFCCPKSSKCISLDDSTSALCCPDGQDCSFIKPITCNIDSQDVTKNPTNLLKTTKLKEDLPKCGDSCCPHGYSCQGGKTCQRDGATASTTTSQSTTSATSTTSSDTSATQMTSFVSSITSQEPSPTSSLFLFPTTAPKLNETAPSLASDCSSFPARAIVAGFFPGLITGILITLLTIVCIGQRRQTRQPQSTYSTKSGHFRNRSSDGAIIGISDPMPTTELQNSVRTDFLRHPPSYDGGASKNSSKSRFYRTGSRVKGLFATSPKANPYTPHMENATPPPPLPPVFRPAPSTPPDQVYPQRQPSTESIKVYSPEHIVRGHGLVQPDHMPSNQRPNTTFTEMMERVGFQSSSGSPHFRVTVTPPTQTLESPR